MSPTQSAVFFLLILVTCFSVHNIQSYVNTTYLSASRDSMGLSKVGGSAGLFQHRRRLYLWSSWLDFSFDSPEKFFVSPLCEPVELDRRDFDLCVSQVLPVGFFLRFPGEVIQFTTSRLVLSFEILILEVARLISRLATIVPLWPVVVRRFSPLLLVLLLSLTWLRRSVVILYLKNYWFMQQKIDFFINYMYLPL